MRPHHPARVTVLLPVLFAIATAPSHVVAGLRLTDDGRPDATIILSERPRGSAQLAAYELQHFIERISGAKLPIVREPAQVQGTRILVGESEATKALGLSNDSFKPQEYLLRTAPDTLVLIGHDRDEFAELDYGSYMSIYNATLSWIATCYAVHVLLENHLDVRWYYPNDVLGHVIPKQPTIVVDELNVRDRPDAEIRSLYPLFSNTERLYYTDYDKRGPFQTKWVDSRKSLLHWIRLRYWGGRRGGANHSFHGYDKAFGESHPEWFSTRSYERMKQLRYQLSVQPCLTAPGFLEQVVTIAREHLDGKPPTFPDTTRGSSESNFAVVPNDNTNMCGCSTCTPLYRNDVGLGGDASHYVWGFLNKVAREVRKTHPDATVSGIAYFNYTLPPKGMVFEPNVSVMFCKFYQRYHDRHYQQRDYDRIREYVEVNGARSFTTYEYPIHPFMDDMPFPCIVPRVQADDVRHLARLPGFMGGTQDRTSLATYRGTQRAGIAWANPVMDFMNVYWRVKLYDDFNLDIEKALSEYYDRFFGPGASGMEKFYTALEDRWMSLGGADAARGWWGKLGTRSFLAELEGHVKEAQEATAEGSIYRERVGLVDAGIMQYLWKARKKYEGSAMSEFAPIGTAAVAHVAVPDGTDWADDATWADALPYEITKTIKNEPAPQKTVFHLAHDGRRLYIRARCAEPYVERIRARTKAHDIGGFVDDSIELFIDPGGRGETYRQLCINTIGTVYDALETPTAIGATANVGWSSKIEAKPVVRDDHWELRAALPFDALPCKVTPGSTLRFNLCRNRFTEEGEPPFSGWSSTLGGFRNPERFGILTFNGPEDRGRLLWHCDFESDAFTTESDAGDLIGFDGWYENTNYANKGWDKSWRVVARDGNRVAVGDLNRTNRSDLVPFHAVQVRSGTVSLEASFRRLGLKGNNPTLFLADRDGKYFATIHAWQDRADMVSIEQAGDRRNFNDDAHGLGDLAGAGRWFGLKVVIDTVGRQVTGYARRGDGDWVRLNETPLPYYDADATGNEVFIGVGSRKLDDGPNNVVEMDDIRVVQLSVEGQ
ncbi:MAG: hypothetical protein CMJ18_06830 [Phycisphaeraceae bacterium]|nr:hypothetical protein [Phycisphaeraceae bacterium]